MPDRSAPMREFQPLQPELVFFTVKQTSEILENLRISCPFAQLQLVLSEVQMARCLR